MSQVLDISRFWFLVFNLTYLTVDHRIYQNLTNLTVEHRIYQDEAYTFIKLNISGSLNNKYYTITVGLSKL